MPKDYGFKEKLMHSLSELSPVDKALTKRAEWFVEQTGIEKYFRKDGKYIDVGTGKGHITELICRDMEKEDKPISDYYGIDIADKPLKKIQRRERKRLAKLGLVTSEKNPVGFSWASADALPFKNDCVDGVSYIFSIHHMDRKSIDEAVNEAKRVLKPDGYLFIAEDLVENEEEKTVTEEVDRKLNWESSDSEHNYKSDKEWEEYFKSKGLVIVEKKFFQSESKKGPIRHGFYVLKKETA